MLCKVFSLCYFVLKAYTPVKAKKKKKYSHLVNTLCNHWKWGGKEEQKNGTHYNEFDDFAWNYWRKRDHASFTCYSIPYLTLSLYSVCQLLFIIASIVPLLFFFALLLMRLVDGCFFVPFVSIHLSRCSCDERKKTTKLKWTIEWNEKKEEKKTHTHIYIHIRR